MSEQVRLNLDEIPVVMHVLRARLSEAQDGESLNIRTALRKLELQQRTASQPVKPHVRTRPLPPERPWVEPTAFVSNYKQLTESETG